MLTAMFKLHGLVVKVRLQNKTEDKIDPAILLYTGFHQRKTGYKLKVE